MKIAVVGSGSIGLYYGGHLANHSHDVRFLMRSGFDSARKRGIRIHGDIDQEINLPNARVFQTTADMGPCDLVIIAIKATSNDRLPELLPPLIGNGTRLLTLQNGLGNEEFLARHWDPDRILGGLCFICLTRDDPSSVHCVSRGLVSIGAFQNAPQADADATAALFREAGIKARSVPNLLLERWRKLVWNIPFNGLSVARGGLTVDQILADHLDTVVTLMREVIAIARADGCPIEEEFIEFQLARSRPMVGYQPSTLVDWRAGNPLEIEPIWTEPLRRAHAAHVPAPALEALHAQLLQA